jgi:hypothetical protein
MALKGKKLHSDIIQWIRDFTMAYKGPTTSAMGHKELALSLSNFADEGYFAWFELMWVKEILITIFAINSW